MKTVLGAEAGSPNDPMLKRDILSRLNRTDKLEEEKNKENFVYMKEENTKKLSEEGGLQNP